VLLLAAAIHAGGSPTVDYTDPKLDNSPSFEGGALHLSVKGGKDIELRWATLAEVDPNGQTVQSVDLSAQKYLWSQIENTDCKDDKGRSTGQQLPHSNFSVQLSNGALFNVSAWVVTLDFTFGNITAKKKFYQIQYLCEQLDFCF